MKSQDSQLNPVATLTLQQRLALVYKRLLAIPTTINKQGQPKIGCPCGDCQNEEEYAPSGDSNIGSNHDSE